jgi:putative DNA methylase
MYRKKLIEVALPLEAINRASAKEKSIRHGHPSTLHLWWARRPLAACRAVLFASLVDDPSAHPEDFPTELDQEKERKRLFGIIERLVLWENVNNRAVLTEAKAEIAKSTGGHPPTIYDPFCGGGSIPLEAQRLGLEAHASDLNPVAVLITKALIELPSKFANRAPINPNSRKKGMKDGAYPGALGLAEDVRYYGEWMADKAFERIGHLYPAVEAPDGTKATVITWLWARTVQCPNPACHAQMPLVRSFQLSTKEGRQAWIEPEVNHSTKRIRFRINTGSGTAPPPPKVGRGAKFRCLVCQQVSPDSHIKSEGSEGRMGTQLLAIVAESKKGRVYLEPSSEHETVARSAKPKWAPDQELGHDPRNIWCVQYGIRRFQDLFTPRQLVALTTFSELLPEAKAQAIADGATKEYSDVISTYLGLGVSRLSDACNSNCTWSPNADQTIHLFTKHSISMIWDFAESNVFAEAAGDFRISVRTLAKALEATPATGFGEAYQLDATAIRSNDVVYSTDPPYFDNISYADLSDFFYVWLRKALFSVYPDLFSTLLVPKAQELVASPFRFDGDNERAEQFFEAGFSKAMEGMRGGQNQEYPLTIFYAFKQSETDNEVQELDTGAVASTGWESMLEGLLRANFQITGTWPMRSERATRSVAQGTNALASSIVLVCRSRPESSGLTTRKDFLVALKRELGAAIKSLQLGNIAPVDLQQAAIGPGMGIFSRYKKVIESDGTPMRVRTALGLINQALDEALSEQESDYDAETRWALTWFEQNQFNEGSFGEANVLASAKALSVDGLEHAGILQARGGRVRLLKREELPIDWNPEMDRHLTVWKVTQQLIFRLATRGQGATQNLAGSIGGMAETARELAYRLYTLCERKGWAEEASYYNALVIAWPAIRSQEFTLTGDK